MKILLFADKSVGLDITKFLISKYKQDLVAVVTVESNEITEYVKQNQIQSFRYNDLMENFELIEGEIDYGILAWWPFLIDKKLLSISKFGFINTHPSYLPLNRGKNPNFWTLVNGDPYGVTIHMVTENIDDGDILAQEKIDYDWCANGATLHKLGQSYMVKLFSDFYPKFRRGECPQKNQGTQGTLNYGSQLHEASEIKLDKLYSGRDILNLLRARTFPGYPGCWFKESKNGKNEFYQATIEIRKLES